MTTLTCREFVELVTAALDGALPPDLHRRVGVHPGGCVGCARYLEQYRRTVRALASLGTHEVRR